VRRRRSTGRLLTTILFTDIVGSTELASELGDRAWRERLRQHHAAVRRELRRHGGREVDTAGDGFFATFDQPVDAVRCALAIRDAVRELGIEIRAGLHFGEAERGEKVGGMAVVIGARIAAAADPGEILVSSTLRELVIGSELRFADRGVHTLKGVAGEWHLFAVEPLPAPVAAPSAPDSARRSATVPRPLLVGAAAAIGVLALAVVVVLALPDPPPAIGPNSVVRIDAASAQVTSGVAVGAGPATLSYADGSLWVANEVDQTVSRVDTATQAEVASRGGVGVPVAIAASGDAVWVADGFIGRLSTIDRRTNEVSIVLDDRAGIGAMAAGFGAIWVVDKIGEAVLRVDQRTEQVLEIPIGADTGPVAIAVGADAIWVANELSMSVARIDPDTNEVMGSTIALCCRPTAIAVSGSTVWVSSAADDRLQRIDADRGAVAETIEAGDGPSGLAADDEAIWVANEDDGTVWKLDPSGEHIATVEFDARPSGVVITDDGVWVSLRAFE
jgi:class 3 adenylate cyclase